jgi:peptidoglycan hydrolase-like protein with peptidoglycan-binding domain
MSNLLKSKFLLGVVMLAVVALGAFALTTTVNAQQAVVSASDIQYAATVRSGSSGQASLIWQKFLNDYSTANLVADGKVGPLSAAQAKIWQAARGLVADGVLGAMSRAAAVAQINAGAPVGTYPAGCTSASGFSSTTGLPCSTVGTYPAGCTSTVGYSPTTGAKCDGAVTTTPTGPLAGTSGELSEINQISSYSNEEVGDGSNDVKVMGFDLVTTNDGDISIKSIKLTFDGANNGGSTRLTDYLDSVSILMGSTVVATVDTSDFTKDSTGVYSKTITLDGSAIIRADKTEKFYVTVDAVSNLDSGDIATTTDDWEVGIDNIRYVDGSGVVTTEADLMPAAIEYNSTGNGVPISFVSFSTSADTELKISLDTSNPDSQVVKVSTTIDTEGVVLLKGKMKLEGTSDVWLDQVPFLLTTTETNLTDVTPTVYLTIDGTEFSESTTASATNTETVVFDNLDLTLIAGKTVSFTVSADINDIQATSFDEGNTLKAELTTTLRDGSSFVAENEQGDALVDATEKTGSALGNEQAFYSKGINVELVSVSKARTFVADATGESDQGEYSVVFDITAFGDDMYIDSSTEDDNGSNAAGQGAVFDVTSSAGTPTVSSKILTAAGTETDDSADSFWLGDGSAARRFTLGVVLTADASTDGSHEVVLESINWVDATTAEAAGGVIDSDFTNYYTFNLDEFKTGSLFLNDM